MDTNYVFEIDSDLNVLFAKDTDWEPIYSGKDGE